MSSRFVSNFYNTDIAQRYQGMLPSGNGHVLTNAVYKDTWAIDCPVRIMLVASGLCTVRRGRDQFALNQNDVFFFFQGGNYTICSTPEMSFEILWLDLSGSGVPSLLERMRITPTECVIQGISDINLERELRSIVSAPNGSNLVDVLGNIGTTYRIASILVEFCSSSDWMSVPHDSPLILYTGAWTYWPSPFDTEHEERYTNTARSYVEFNFYGTGIRWLGTMNFDCGKADVIIDGVYQTEVDTYNTVRLTKQILYCNNHLPNGHHIIKIFCTGENNTLATNCDVVVESFQYTCALSEPKTSGAMYKTSMVRRAIEIMDANYPTGISIDSITAELRISRTYFTNRFAAETGTTPLNYLINLRMTKAKLLLLDTDLSIGEIAGRVGYSDAFYFSRVFKKHENMTPSQYRQLKQ